MGNRMMISVLTCGEHIPIGNEPENYDGPLTLETKEKLRAIKVPPFEKCFIGIMLRHIETAQAVLSFDALRRSHSMIGEIGYDQWMFAVINEEENGGIIIKNFLKFLRERKKDGLQAILLITSRIYPLILNYYGNGGEKRFGPFSSRFIRTHLPTIENGGVSQFEI